MTAFDPAPLLDSLPADCRAAAHLLNRDCACLALDHDRLAAALAAGGEPLHGEILRTRPHLFSDTLVFVAEAHLRRMAELAAAVERVVALPAYRERVLAHGPEIAAFVPGARGVFLGYDYHLGADGPRLIEINTNAGGGLLNAKLAAAQRACCGAVEGGLPAATEAVEDAFFAMFLAEWRLERGDVPLRRIAIVDETPTEQYLAPEFELFRRLFTARGVAAVVVDPRELRFADGQLRVGEDVVDLVYNRLTDFAFDEPAVAALRSAYLARAAVVTPHPHAHALYADKRNLAVLSDADWLRAAGVDAATQAVLLECIPHTVEVTGATAEAFWSTRKKWFFKPVAGFGSKAAYRGEKVTKRVFEEIAAGGYVAQALVPPSERRLQRGLEATAMKLDLRNYVYAGNVQLVAARLYQGQTTNFRTPGGGFAAVSPVACRTPGEACT
jgi:hypothetical protein